MWHIMTQPSWKGLCIVTWNAYSGRPNKKQAVVYFSKFKINKSETKTTDYYRTNLLN